MYHFTESNLFNESVKLLTKRFFEIICSKESIRGNGSGLGFVQIPDFAVFALDYLNYVFLYWPSVQVRMKTKVCVELSLPDGTHTYSYSVVKM